MSTRSRHHVMLVVSVLAAVAYGELTGAAEGLGFYAGLAGVIVAVGLIGLPWIEMAPDGAFRRKPRPRA